MRRLVNKLFQMFTLCGEGAMTTIKNLNPKLVNLNGVLLNFQGLPKMNEQAATKQMLLVRGKRIKYYDCKGSCEARAYSCYKLGVKCTSECHKENIKFQTCDYISGIIYENYYYVELF